MNLGRAPLQDERPVSMTQRPLFVAQRAAELLERFPETVKKLAQSAVHPGHAKA